MQLLRLFTVGIVFESCSSVGNITSILRSCLFFAMFLLLIQNLNYIGGRDGSVDVHDCVLGLRIAADRARRGVCRGEAAGWRALGVVHLHKESQIK